MNVANRSDASWSPKHQQSEALKWKTRDRATHSCAHVSSILRVRGRSSMSDERYMTQAAADSAAPPRSRNTAHPNCC